MTISSATNAAATDRLAKAMDANKADAGDAKPKDDAKRSTGDAAASDSVEKSEKPSSGESKPKRSTGNVSRAERSDAGRGESEVTSTPRSVADRPRGASAAPDAASGASQVMGSGQPGTAAASYPSTYTQVPTAGHEVPTAGYEVMGTGQPGTPSYDDGATSSGNAWNDDWSARFGDVMSDMGMSDAEIEQQISDASQYSYTEDQLRAAYDEMSASVSAASSGNATGLSDEWRSKFADVMTQSGTPAAEQQQVFDLLESSNLTESQIAEAYTQIQNDAALYNPNQTAQAEPAWNEEWENKFQALNVPEALVSELAQSGAPEHALEQQYRSMLDTKIEYKRDGRLERLQKAGADANELWGVMSQGMDGKDFDKAVEQIKSSNVPGWKRITSFALNLVPGAYALQFVTGKDWITGEKIDRSNPLNIVGAVASGFAGFTAVRSAVAGVRGLSAANAAAQASKAAAGGAALSDAVTGASALSQGSFKAMQAANLVDKFDKGLKFTDYLKSAVPLVNRFGEAGRLSSFGRGYYQAMQLSAGMASLKTVADGGVAVDKATKGIVMDGLRRGESIQDALAAAGRTSGTGGGYAIRAQDVARDASRYGFLQGGVGKLGEGNRIMRGSGNLNVNPFRNTATISQTATEGVYSLGRGVNFGTNAGLAQGIGLIRGANSVSNAGLYAQAAVRAEGANRLMNGANAQKIVGLNITDDVQRIETIKKTTEWAERLGLTDGNRFRSLLRLTGSNQAVHNAASVVAHGDSSAYRAMRYATQAGQRYATFATGPLVGGAAIGMTGKQVQPAWEQWQNRHEIRAEEAARMQAAEEENAYLEQVYADQLAADRAAGGSGQAPATPVDGYPAADGSTVVDGSELTGGETPVYVDPNTGFYVDPQTGLMADPSTGIVYDQQGNVVGELDQAAAA